MVSTGDESAAARMRRYAQDGMETLKAEREVGPQHGFAMRIPFSRYGILGF